MIRIFFCLILGSLYTFIFAIEFKEERIMQALNHSIIKKGHIEFDKNSVVLQYENDNNHFSFKNNQLVQLPENIVIENQASLIYFTLLQAIFNEDMQTLEYYFNVSKKEKVYQLSPKSLIANYIEAIEFIKNGIQLKQLIIFLKNSDRIIIEPLY